MKVESSRDKNRKEYIPQDETGRVVTTYEEYESKGVRKCVCDCKHFRVKGMEAECRLYDDDGKEVGFLKLPNEDVWSCFAGWKPIAISKDNKYLILPGIGVVSSACFDIATNQLLWSWPKNFFYIYFSDNSVYAEWCLTSKGGIKVFDIKTGKILREVMSYNTKMHHPLISRLNEQYLFFFSQGGIFLMDLFTDKIYMSKKVFPEMHEDVRARQIKVDEKTNSICLTLINIGLMPECGIDNGLGWKYKDIIIPMDEILEDMKESPLGIKLPTTNAGIERAYKKLWGKEV